MQFVIDKNSFESPEFEEFMADPRSVAVVTDYACMESYTGHSMYNIHQTIQPLSKITDRVILLRSAADLCGVDPRHEGWLDLFEQENPKEELEVFCGQVEEAVHGNVAYADAVERNAKEAQAHLDRLMEEAKVLALGFVELVEDFGRDAYKGIYEANAPLEVYDLLTGTVFKMTAKLFETHPNAYSLPREMKDIRNTYIFRYALVGVLVGLKWLGTGISMKTPPNVKKVRNDIIDANYIVCATFYDGLLTKDQKMAELYDLTQAMLTYYYTEDFGTPPASEA